MFTGATLIASLTPGPAVLLAIGTSLRDGARAALRAIAGICLGGLAYLVVALAGMIAVLAAHRPLFRAVQIGGAAYLVFLGVRSVAGGTSAHAIAEGAPASSRGRRPFTAGLLTQLGNPKTILYWTALVPPFVDPARSISGQLVVIAAIGTAVDLVVLAGYAVTAARVRRWMASDRHQRALNLAAGTLFAVVGLTLIAFNLH